MDLRVTDNVCLNQTLAHLAANLTDDPARCTSDIHIDHGLWLCDGYPNTNPGGSWVGHMLPCLIFMVWSSHWMFGIFRQYLERKHGEAYVALPYHHLLWIPCDWPLEPLCKFLLPPFVVGLELSWAHAGGYRNLMCPADSVRAGHFVGNHLGNWSHATMYVGFIISGAVDLVGRWVDLPGGTEKVFLSLAFLLEAMLMGLHKKHAPLDILLHQLLTASMLATSAAVMLERAWPQVFLFSCGRVAALALQGLWFHALARILYDGIPAWDPISDMDIAPLLFTPIFIIMHIIGILVVLSAVFLIMAWTYDPNPLALSRPAAGLEGGSKAERGSLLASVDEE